MYKVILPLIGLALLAGCAARYHHVPYAYEPYYGFPYYEEPYFGYYEPFPGFYGFERPFEGEERHEMREEREMHEGRHGGEEGREMHEGPHREGGAERGGEGRGRR